MDGLPTELSTGRLWITCRADKTPLRGTSKNPVYTLDELPKDVLRGFVFTEGSGLIGIDLDHCLGEDGLFTELASEILQLIPATAYVEYSLSGSGIHIIGKYNGAYRWKNRPGEIELYTSGRYFVITGRLYNLFAPGPTLPDLTDVVEHIIKHYGMTADITPTAISNPLEVTKDDIQRTRDCLKLLNPDCDYGTWSRIGLSIGNSFKCTEYRKDAARLFAAWSKGSPKFNDKAKDSILAFFDPSVPLPSTPLTLSTLYSMCPTVGQKEKLSMLEDTPPELPPNVPSAPRTLSYKEHPSEIAQEFIEYKRCFTVTGRTFTLWDKNKWVLDVEPLYISQCLKEFIYLRGYNVKPVRGGGYVETVNIPSKDLQEVLNQIRICAVRSFEALPRPNSWFAPATQEADPYVLALRNGLYSVKQRRLLGPHAIEFYNTGVIPCDYDMDAECPRFLEGLALTFGAEDTPEDIEDNIASLQLWFGYILLFGYSQKKLCVLLGDSNSGKSTLLRIMYTLVGKQYYKALGAGALEGKRTDFGVGFDSNLLGGYDEFPFDKKFSSMGDLIKMCTGDISIEQRGLYSAPKTVDVLMKFVFTSNVSPDFFSDPMGGLMNRILIWRCSAIPKEKLDFGYVKYIEKQELSGVLNWALKGAERLLEGEKLRQPGGTSGELYNEFRASTRTHLEQWVEDTFLYSEDEEGFVTNEALIKKLRYDLRDVVRNPQWRGLNRWVDEKAFADKTLVEKIRKAIFHTVFPKCKKYENHGSRGVKGLVTRLPEG